MSFAKWIGASIGWSFGGPIGAIIGLAIGSMVDSSVNQTKRQKIYNKTQPGDFEISLLILSSLVIKADGKQDKRELDLFVIILFKCMVKNVQIKLLNYLKQ